MTSPGSSSVNNLPSEKDGFEEGSLSATSIQKEYAAFDPKERARILRKLDFHLLPFVALLYLVSFLDRANIGNARIAGMADDLDLYGLRYNIAAAVFSIPYALAEVPSNILLKLFRPSRWIPSIMCAWGVVMTLMCLVKTYEGLIIARVFLGLAEAGLFPGVTYYLSHWYPRGAFAMRIAIFFSAATIAGAFGGLLAYGIEKMDGIGGLHGWQWIFCLEGLGTILVASFAFYFMQDYPETATFLTPSERQHIIEMIKEDSKGLATGFDKKYIWQGLTDYKTYLQIAIHMGLLITAYSIALFAPTIVRQLGYTATHAQLLTVPIFVCGCVSTIVMGILSDKLHLRGPFIVGCSLISLMGYIILYNQQSPRVGYAGAIIAAIGVYPTVPVSLAWIGGNVGGNLKKGVVIAMVIGMGNLGGLCSAFIYFDGPRFHTGHGTIMGWLSLSILLTCVAMFEYTRCNKAKEVICKEQSLNDSHLSDFAEMGDASPLFKYKI